MRQARICKLISTTALLAGALGALPMGAAQAQAVDADKILKLEAKTFEIPDSQGIKMVRIEKGQFSAGSPAGEPGRWDDEKQRTVTISRPFYMAEAEITQEQYIPVIIPDYKPFFTNAAAYGNSLPEVHQDGPFNTVSTKVIDPAKYPMDGVVWAKAVEFCSKITERERKAGRLPKSYIYRLPTEAEWEYACRAGSTGRFNTESTLESFAVALGKETPGQVKGTRTPNAWGLYDMHGNVYEWCLDWYGPYSGDAVDPVGPAKGEKKVARGGCYISGKLDGRAANPDMDQRCLRSAARGKFLPDFPLPIIGFRIVLGPDVASSSVSN